MIADMSGVEKPSVFDNWFGLRGLREIHTEHKSSSPDRDARNIQASYSTGDTLDPEERRSAIFGALGASLLIGVIYLAAFAILIVLLLILWKVL